MTYLLVTRGDDEILDILTTDKDTGALVDLSGAQLTFMAKRRRTDADADALITKTVGTGIAISNQVTDKGEAVVTINAGDTDAKPAGAFWWELQSKDGGNHVATLASGRFVILADLIRTA